ncbi:MAG: TetR/AcrR family transcriptional regulator [Marinobacter sp.]|nr:TetR/AcrR family transcriptional regulator [Marinobacter sp.]
MQARSTARLTALLDAAASIVDEVGIERLTTAMVAERAGASIGTVYRYFPDRIVLLQALGSRNFERVMARITEAINDPSQSDWRGALSTAFDSVIDTYRTEPGIPGASRRRSTRSSPVAQRPYAQVTSGRASCRSAFGSLSVLRTLLRRVSRSKRALR